MFCNTAAVSLNCRLLFLALPHCKIFSPDCQSSLQIFRCSTGVVTRSLTHSMECIKALNQRKEHPGTICSTLIFPVPGKKEVLQAWNDVLGATAISIDLMPLCSHPVQSMTSVLL